MQQHKPSIAWRWVASLRCPTCGAEQVVSDECRRCGCDLRQLRVAWDAAAWARQACLDALRRKDPGRALSAARLLHELCPDCDARRLLSVCHLLCGEHDRAFALARQDAAEVAAVQ